MHRLKWIVPVIAFSVILYWASSDQKTTELGSLSDAPASKPDHKKHLPYFDSSSMPVQSDDITGVEAALPKSLRGTDIEGGFRIDEHGNLIIELGVKRYFDYFLATVGEEPIAEITARIRRGIESQLDDPAKTQALKLLEDYLSYKVALYELETSDELQQSYSDTNPLEVNRSQLPQLAARMEAIMAARRTHFDSEAVEAFFAGEEMFDHYTLAKLKIMHDESLSDEARDEQLRSLDETLPPQVQKRREEVTQYQRYQVKETEMKEQNATDAEIHQLRAQEFGEEAAMRLAELDQQRSKWELRIQAYRKEKIQLDRAGLSQQDLSEQLNALRHSHFSELEVRRVTALDQISGG